MTVEQLRLVLVDPYRWKWVIIALHNALQSFLVHAVSGTALVGAMTLKFQRRWHEAYERGEILRTGERLATVKELMERARDLKGYTYTKPLPPNAEQDLVVHRLGDWRDTFVHYKPGGLTIEVSGFSGICTPCLDIIEFLAFETGHVFSGRNQSAERVRKALDEAWGLLRSIEESYSS